MDTNEIITGKDKVEEAPDLQGKSRSYVQEVKRDEPRRHVFFRICAVVGLLCAMAGWLLFYFEPVAAVAVGCTGICASVCGIFSGRGCLRSVAVTGLVASSVLVLVYVAFYWGLAWGVSHL